VKKLTLVLLGAVLAAGVAAADTLSYDASLTSPPGVYFGTGNSNSNFTITTNGTTELGLSVIQRYIGPIDPGSGSNVYDVQTGATTVPGKTGPTWGVDFSVNTQYNGGSDVLDAFNYSLTVVDLTTSTTLLSGFNPVTSLPDDSGYGSGGATNGVNVATEWGAQNSEPLSILAGFNENSPDLYEITLSEVNSDHRPTESVTVFANATGAPPVPEPGSWVLLGTIALGVVYNLQKRKRVSN